MTTPLPRKQMQPSSSFLFRMCVCIFHLHVCVVLSLCLTSRRQRKLPNGENCKPRARTHGRKQIYHGQHPFGRFLLTEFWVNNNFHMACCVVHLVQDSVVRHTDYCHRAIERKHKSGQTTSESCCACKVGCMQHGVALTNAYYRAHDNDRALHGKKHAGLFQTTLTWTTFIVCGHRRSRFFPCIFSC